MDKIKPVRHFISQETMAEIYAYIEAYPGTDKKKVLEMSGAKTHNAECVLTKMDSNGFYLSEDDDGLLYTFKLDIKKKTNRRPSFLYLTTK